MSNWQFDDTASAHAQAEGLQEGNNALRARPERAEEALQLIAAMDGGRLHEIAKAALKPQEEA